jgi:uncharacterized protein (DUF1330 family)
MKTRYAMALAVVAAASAAATVHGLHAQAKPTVYYVAELDVMNPGNLKAYADKMESSIKTAGGRYLVRGTNITMLEGTPPKFMVITAWDSLDKLKAWWDGPYNDMRPMRANVHRSVRAYAVEGVPN